MAAVSLNRMAAVSGGSGIPVIELDDDRNIRSWVLNLKAFGYTPDEALCAALRYFYSYSPDTVRRAVDKAYGR